jgi:hypothetical protein
MQRIPVVTDIEIDARGERLREPAPHVVSVVRAFARRHDIGLPDGRTGYRAQRCGKHAFTILS